MSWKSLCLWHHVYYIRCHPYCVYDYTSSISDLKPVKTAISSTLYVITPSLSKTSDLLGKTSQVAYVCHHMRYIWHHIHTLWHQPLLFMTSNALYSFHHTHYIWHLIYSVWCHIHYVCYVTQWPSLWHQTLYVCDIFTLYGNTHSVMTTQSVCAFTATMPVITLSVFLTLHTMYHFMKRSQCMSSQPIYVWHHMHYIWHHLHALWHHATLFMMSSPLYLTSHSLYLTSRLLYLRQHTHSLNDITATLCMISHTVYMWHPIHYVYDIISTM